MTNDALVCHKGNCYQSEKYALRGMRRMIEQHGMQPGQLEPYCCPHHTVEVWHLRNVDRTKANRHRKRLIFSYEIGRRIAPGKREELMRRVRGKE
ncbi:MAG: hypothetical protein ACRDTZ_07315 [Pseudonocardiaceae bacterium]